MRVQIRELLYRFRMVCWAFLSSPSSLTARGFLFFVSHDLWPLGCEDNRNRNNSNNKNNTTSGQQWCTAAVLTPASLCHNSQHTQQQQSPVCRLLYSYMTYLVAAVRVLADELQQARTQPSAKLPSQPPPLLLYF